jgi:hypothetical protein
MALPPNIQVHATGEELTVTVSGLLLARDVIEVIKTQYPGFRGPRILWDLTAADLTALSRDDLSDIALTARTHAPAVERRTAYAVSGQADAVILWKYLTETVRVHVPVEYKVFTAVAEARQWLQQS